MVAYGRQFKADQGGLLQPAERQKFRPEGNNVRRKTYDSAPEYQA
jgi:hypothetical protein